MNRIWVTIMMTASLAVLAGGLMAPARGRAGEDAAADAKADSTADAKADSKSDAKAAPKSKADDPKKQALSKFMRDKLVASNQVMEGLVTEDFALIQKGAASMRKLSAAEEWQVSNDSMYRQHSAQFRRVVDQLDKKAKDKQLDGAALAWMEATMSCIECHKWVRNVLVAERSGR